MVDWQDPAQLVGVQIAGLRKIVMAEMKFNCPKCQQLIACDELWAGHDLQCPTCHTEILVPSAAAPGATAAPAEVSGSQGSTPGSLVPQVPTSAAPRLSIGQARHQPMSAPPQASATSTTARAAAQFVRPKKKSALVSAIPIVVGIAVLGVAGYFGYNWYQKNQETKAAEAQKATNALAAAQSAAQPEMVPPTYTLDVNSAVIPQGKVNGKIAGTNFVPETCRLEVVGTSPVLRFYQGAASAPDHEILIYLRPKPGEKWSGHTWTVSSDMKAPAAPQVAKRWKETGKPTPTLQNYATGYAMKLDFGKIENGEIPGKIYIALPDPDQTVIAGNFKASTPFTENPSPAPTPAVAAPQPRPSATPAIKARPEERYGVQ